MMGRVDGDRRSDYLYDLPPERIAQRPVEPRDAARLLVLPRSEGAVADRRVSDLPDLLEPGDLLVVNDTRVFPARLLGRREDTGGAVEVLLVGPEVDPGAGGEAPWRAVVSPARRMRPGVRLVFRDGVACEVLGGEGDERVVRFDGGLDGFEAARLAGTTPLPPYVRRPAEPGDEERYQTVYARERGAVAAPTAGLHFTPALLDRLAARGIERAAVTLHVGPGTFRPVASEDLGAHRIEPERFVVPPETARAVARARDAGRRVVAVGTTTVRALESVATEGGVRPASGRADLFVRPPFRFRAVTALLTNFHLPGSTLLMLVAAFAGRERVLAAYRHAVEAGYRFYSYGDAMLVR
jgi:S-adenosylmethionine:tRNA ribosyltransferase-isomerase